MRGKIVCKWYGVISFLAMSKTHWITLSHLHLKLSTPRGWWLYVPCTVTVCTVYCDCKYRVLWLYVPCTVTVCTVYCDCMYCVLWLYVPCTVTVCTVYCDCMYCVLWLYVPCIVTVCTTFFNVSKFYNLQYIYVFQMIVRTKGDSCISLNSINW